MVKKLGTLINKESEFIHSPFNGEQILGREAITVTVKLSDGKWHEVKLQSYSPFGLEFINDGLNLKQGDPITLRVKLAGDETEFDGLIVNSVYEENNLKLAGVRTFIKEKTSSSDYSGQDRRIHRRWSCSEDFLPTGTAPNPVRYNDYILFRVNDISSGGLRLITSMRNKFIGIGQRLECTLSLPYVGTVRAYVKVKHVTTTFYRDKEFMVIGVEFIKTDPILLKTLGEYLLNFAKEITIKSLNREGFGVRSVSKWIDFSYVKTEEEYKEVLALRLKTYTAVGKIPKGTKAEDMASLLDSKSQIVTAKYDGHVVGSIACIFPEKEEDISISGEVEYPKNFPKINELVYVWRLCVDPKYRSADITYGLISRVVNSAISSKRRYIGCSTVKNIRDFYIKCGTKDTNIKYINKNLHNLEHSILLMDTHAVVKGKGVGIKYWNLIYRDLLESLLTSGDITLTPGDRIKIWIYKKLGKH